MNVETTLCASLEASWHSNAISRAYPVKPEKLITEIIFQNSRTLALCQIIGKKLKKEDVENNK